MKAVDILRELLEGKEVVFYKGCVFKYRNGKLFFRKKSSMYQETDISLVEFIKQCE